MDLQGMALLERLLQIIFTIATAISFVVGLATASFVNSMWVFVGGVAAATIICVPDWPFFNRSPLQFLPPLGDDEKLFDPLTLFGEASSAPSSRAASVARR
eukprot:Amastigsp_a212524_4.p2 type:complete len:101 gc:universal Amastigsp_a212524_4:36-338(+)